jgi:hypothetical protein
MTVCTSCPREPSGHLTRYVGVLSSHSKLRSQVVPKPVATANAAGADPAARPASPAVKSRYIPWAELLRRTFSIDIQCAKCGHPLRLRALIKTPEVIVKILVAMNLPSAAPELHPARPPPGAEREAGNGEGSIT